MHVNEHNMVTQEGTGRPNFCPLFLIVSKTVRFCHLSPVVVRLSSGCHPGVVSGCPVLSDATGHRTRVRLKNDYTFGDRTMIECMIDSRLIAKCCPVVLRMPGCPVGPDNCPVVVRALSGRCLVGPDNRTGGLKKLGAEKSGRPDPSWQRRLLQNRGPGFIHFWVKSRESVFLAQNGNSEWLFVTKISSSFLEFMRKLQKTTKTENWSKSANMPENCQLSQNRPTWKKTANLVKIGQLG